VRLLGMLYELRVTRSPAELLDELRQEPLKVLDQVAQGLERGLAQTFTVAFGTLEPNEHRMLLALAAAASATRDCILAEVSGLQLRAAKDALERLRNWSLAEFSFSSSAPWGLHDVVRLFAQSQPDYPTLVNAHQDWVKAHCQKYKKPEEHAEFALGADEVATAVRRFIAENNPDAASSLHWPLWQHMNQVGRVAELANLTEELLASVPKGTATEAAWLGNLGLCYDTLGDIPKAMDYYQRALDIDTKLGSLKGQAIRLGNLGLCYETLGDIAKARDYLTRSVALFECMGMAETQEHYAYYRQALKKLE
jgi:tetratricopeptide (TPR) repeat protein